MRPSRKLGGVVLLLLSVSGCAAVQPRVNESAQNPDETAPSRSSGWFGSRFGSRPTPTSASAAAGTSAAPDVETARPTAPETDIWPVPRSASGLSRVLPMLGNRDPGKKTPPADDLYPSLASLSTPTAAPDGSNDRQVRPASGDEAPKTASTRQQPARTQAARNAQGDAPELLPSRIVDGVPVKPHNRPEARGAVALEVEPADLNGGDEATRGPIPRDLAASSSLGYPEIGQPAQVAPVRTRPRREAYLIATAARADDLTTTGGDEPAQPSASSTQPAPSAEIQQPKSTTPNPPATAPATTPSTGPAPPPITPTTPSAGPPPPPLGPATSPPPATDSAPVPSTAPAPSAPATAPVPVPGAATAPVPGPESVPTAEPGPKPGASTLETAPPVTAVSAPAGQGLATVLAPTPAASGQGSPALAQVSPSPQASSQPAGKPAKPPHKNKPCWLLTWLHSLHQPAPSSKCQLPPAMFPTTYQTCVPGPGPKPAGQTVTVAGSVHPSPQSLRTSAPPSCACTCTCPAKAPKASCFSWFHYGMASDFFAKVRGWRHGCACHCHDSEFRLWWGTCKRCASKCGGPPAPTASPQASPSPVLPQSQLGMGSWSPVPSDLPESNQVLERIASQGLDKTP